MPRLVVIACALWVCGVESRSRQPDDLALILRGLAARTQQYYDRFISIICTETVHQQELKPSLAPSGRPRVTVYELNVTRDPHGTGESAFRVERMPLRVNGGPVRPNHKPQCTDPKTGSPEPMAFLLAGNQHRYRFSLPDLPGLSSSTAPPGALPIDFVETPPAPVGIKWEGYCFEAEGGGHQGRVWFDPVSYDVLQVDVRLSTPFMVPVPRATLGFQTAIRVERSEMTLRFSRVDFRQPDETVLLPLTIDTLHVLRGIPSLRISQTLTNYRRFLTRSEIRTPF